MLDLHLVPGVRIVVQVQPMQAPNGHMPDSDPVKAGRYPLAPFDEVVPNFESAKPNHEIVFQSRVSVQAAH